MTTRQASLFEAVGSLPPGFRYQPALMPAAEERDLVAHLENLPFRAFEFHGYVGRRRVVSFGWQYDFNTSEFRRAGEMPDFLLPLRDAAARFAGLAASALEHALITEYAPGAAIGWHKDK